MSSTTNPYSMVRSRVLKVVKETPTIYTIRLKPDREVPFNPGQFIQLTVPGVGEAPFTPSSHYRKPETLDVTVARVGKVTDRIHQLSPGDEVGIRGPYGNNYPLEDFRGREVLVVGGGVGFAPMRAVMYGLFDIVSSLAKLLYRGGCRNPSELVYREEMSRWFDRNDLDIVLTVDEGDETWQGPTGVVTTILEDLDVDFESAVAIVCGPPIMMKFSTLKLLEMGFSDSNIFLSMEKNMSCAIGQCGHCRIGPYYCCTDGPVFRYSQIKQYPNIWD